MLRRYSVLFCSVLAFFCLIAPAFAVDCVSNSDCESRHCIFPVLPTGEVVPRGTCDPAHCYNGVRDTLTEKDVDCWKECSHSCVQPCPTDTDFNNDPSLPGYLVDRMGNEYFDECANGGQAVRQYFCHDKGDRALAVVTDCGSQGDTTYHCRIRQTVLPDGTRQAGIGVCEPIPASTATTTTCSETDHGDDPEHTGTVTEANGTTHTDGCSGTTLVEYFCAAEGYLQSHLYPNYSSCTGGGTSGSSGSSGGGGNGQPLCPCWMMQGNLCPYLLPCTVALVNTIHNGVKACMEAEGFAFTPFAGDYCTSYPEQNIPAGPSRHRAEVCIHNLLIDTVFQPGVAGCLAGDEHARSLIDTSSLDSDYVFFDIFSRYPPDNCPLTTNGNQVDRDRDGSGDACDNCSSKTNADQKDTDSDGIGDVCDNCATVSNPPDFNKNHPLWEKAHQKESCLPKVAGPSGKFQPTPGAQWDLDNDTLGDACDNDPDGDETLLTQKLGAKHPPDNCPWFYNPDQKDSDGDGVGDACDNCLNISNTDQIDDDCNGIGNACDTKKGIIERVKSFFRK